MDDVGTGFSESCCRLVGRDVLEVQFLFGKWQCRTENRCTTRHLVCGSVKCKNKYMLRRRGAFKENTEAVRMRRCMGTENFSKTYL